MTINTNMNPVIVHLDETNQFQPSFAERNPLLRTVEIIATRIFVAVLVVPLALAAILMVPLMILTSFFYHLIISPIISPIEIEEHNDFPLLPTANAVLINPPDLENPTLPTADLREA